MSRIRSFLLLAAAATAVRLSWRMGWQCARAAAVTKRSRGIIQHASDAIISTDEQQHILQVNPAAASMFDTTMHAMQGASLAHYIPRDQRQQHGNSSVQYFGATGIRMRMKGRRTGDYAVTGLKANGQHFPLEGTISSLAENGSRIYTIILRDVTERKQVQEQLEQSYSQLRELSAALQTIREEERKHIARELHDDLGQLLATLRGDLALLQRQGSSNAAARKLQKGMDELLMSAITSLRRIAGNLRPRALDEGGLYFALESLRHEFEARNNIACTLDANEEELILDDAYSTAIFRIAQEALTNITRHAEAHKVALSLYRKDGALHITIHDDGRGIAEKDMDKATSFGLIGMRERVWALHGDIAIASDGGTRIMIRLPLPPSEPA
ncbi:PAS domain S-box-containing protein [Duganella sp. CF402]|uniref:PAS domain-containing sensor histidine kinase n=1 Tax=unclassified Duganella TaxID=2636909 RepID=UPI0008CBB583|nr:MULTISPECIES: PAS domain-containing sensor histidine kinase [unclassified Duganella]RZT01840.1 PAS domain S-box-containing protein [Duganella sp. BK701]SEN21881.1 PAS domain S-box-containing protein [Duganella sp. CF402]